MSLRNEKTGRRRTLALFAISGLMLLSGLLSSGQAQTPGSLDTAFGTGGKITTANQSAQAMVIQPDGKIVVAGFAVATGGNINFALVRYQANGSLDTTFGTGGKVTTDFFGFNDQVFGLALQTDGKILAVGFAQTGPAFNTGDFALARYNANGSLDETFGTSGRQTTDFFEEDFNEDLAYKVLVQPDGKIVVVGSSQNQMVPGAPASLVVLTRYHADGSLDEEFGTDGKVINTFGVTYTRAHTAVLEPDGKIVTAGYANVLGSGSDFAIARYKTNGQLDETFGTGGIYTNDIAATADIAEAMVRQPDGRFVVVGRANQANTNSNFAVARYLNDGHLDPSFDTDGKLTTDFSAGVNDWARSVVIQPDGKIVVAGLVLGAGTERDFALARYHANGALDQSFGTGGKMTTDFFGLSDQVNAAAVHTNGRIVVAGIARQTDNGTSIALARYFTTSAHALAPSDFDGDGKSDVAAFRPSDGGWYALQSSDNSLRAQAFGLSTDRIAPGDYDGDGKVDLVVFRSGIWYMLNSSDNAFRAVQFGIQTDVPVAGDYDGDGRTDIAVFREGAWHILQSSNQAYRAEQFGLATDKPVAGDYDGDGKTDLAVFRPAGASWYVLQSSDGGFRAAQFGIETDRPVQGDYDGDGRTDFAVYRPAGGAWYIEQTTGGFRAEQFGLATDMPAPGDYDGDGRLDIAVFRGGAWYISQSSNGLLKSEQFGTEGDRAVPSAYIP